MFFPFLFTMFGWWFKVRLIHPILQHFGISNSKISYYVLFSDAFALLFFGKSLVLILSWHFLCLTVIFFIPWLSQSWFEERYRETLLKLLDEIVLHLHNGKSFRKAIHEAIQNEKSWMQKHLLELFHHMQFNEAKRPLDLFILKDFFEEISTIDRSQSRCLEQVQSLRKSMKSEQNFRKKSKQVLYQIRIQSFIMSLLYVALLAYVIHEFGFYPYHRLILISGLLFLFGMLVIFYRERKLRWKI